MLSVGDGIAIGGFIIVVAQFVRSKSKKENDNQPHEFESCSAQYGELDKKVVVLENEMKHANNTLNRIESAFKDEISERKDTESEIFKRIDAVLREIKHRRV